MQPNELVLAYIIQAYKQKKTPSYTYTLIQGYFANITISQIDKNWTLKADKTWCRYVHLGWYWPVLTWTDAFQYTEIRIFPINKIQVQLHVMSPHPRQKEECHSVMVFTVITEVPLTVFVMKTNHLMDLPRNQKLL